MKKRNAYQRAKRGKWIRLVYVSNGIMYIWKRMDNNWIEWTEKVCEWTIITSEWTTSVNGQKITSEEWTTSVFEWTIITSEWTTSVNGQKITSEWTTSVCEWTIITFEWTTSFNGQKSHSNGLINLEQTNKTFKLRGIIVNSFQFEANGRKSFVVGRKLILNGRTAYMGAWML